jgi:hypothetical protein
MKSNLEIAELYERQALHWEAEACKLDKENPEAAFHVRDYGQHCKTMAVMLRQDALEEELGAV